MSDHASKTKGLMWIVVACLVGACFAFGLSPMAHAIPWGWEKKLGYVFDSDFTNRECRSTLQAQELLQRLVKRIYPVTPEDGLISIDVRVVQDPAINAYAELGGRISVNSGLLQQAESPEELAGILSHEIGHVQNRHIMQGMIVRMMTVEGLRMIFSGGTSSTVDWTRYFLNMSFTRTQESQADEAGLRRLQKAHVDNQGFRHFFERMEKSGSASAFISDHPSNRERLEMAETFDNNNVMPVMTSEEWQVLKNYCRP